MLLLGLIIIILLVLFLPVTIHWVEKNIELFLMAMGVLAVTMSHFWGPAPAWTCQLVTEALNEPIKITIAVFVVGLLIHFFNDPLTRAISRTEKTIGDRCFSFLLVVLLGILSSVITAIMAALILCEVVLVLNYKKEFETRLVILGCFSIGLGAALTPLGEPLSTIFISKLRGAPYHADFFFLMKNFGWYLVGGVLAVGLTSLFLKPERIEQDGSIGEMKEELNLKHVFGRAAKVYIFILGLVFLGTGMKPIIEAYVVKMPAAGLYWLNSISAIVDNATLTSAEIDPAMTIQQLHMALMGLLISGGMLIPGNIPNIISANRLKIGSRDWARFGVPYGAVFMIVFFIILLAF